MSNSENTLDKQYGLYELRVEDVSTNPFEQFRLWYEAAFRADIVHPNAFTLATCSADAKPSARQLLLKGFDQSGFVFYTNSESRKAGELSKNPFASLCFWWGALERQVRIEGRVEPVSEGEADEYFSTRPRGSQIGAWTSHQSTVIPGREFLDKRYAKYEAEFKDKPVPRPPYWKGYRVVPDAIEFWQGRQDRLHDRIRYKLQPDGQWLIERLAP